MKHPVISKVIPAILVVSGTLVPALAYAASSSNTIQNTFQFQPIVNLPVPGQGGGGQTSLGCYFNQLFRLSITVAIVLAVIMIVIEGFKYMTTEAVGGKKDALAGIRSTLFGLVLLLASWLLLHIINPKITSLQVPGLNITACGATTGQQTTPNTSTNTTQNQTPSQTSKPVDKIQTVVVTPPAPPDGSEGSVAYSEWSWQGTATYGGTGGEVQSGENCWSFDVTSYPVPYEGKGLTEMMADCNIAPRDAQSAAQQDDNPQYPTHFYGCQSLKPGQSVAPPPAPGPVCKKTGP